MSDTPRTDAARIDNADLSDWGTGKSDYVSAEFARELERENAALLLVAQYYAQGGPSDGGSYARIKLAEIDGITGPEQDSENAKQRAEDIREHNAERLRGINSKD